LFYNKNMKKLLLVPFLIVLSFCSPDFYRYNVKMGIKAARMRLWKEALYRFQRASTYRETAEVYNDMAVAYEALGDFKKAEYCYNKALQLDPRNERIRANYAIFQELKKRQKFKEKLPPEKMRRKRKGKK